MDPAKAAQQLRVQHQRNRRLEESNESLQSALDDARKEFAKHLQETRLVAQQLEDEHRRSDALLAALEAQKEDFAGKTASLQARLTALQQQLEQSSNSQLVSEHAAEQLQKQLDRQTQALSKALSERDSHRQDALAYQSALAACDSRLHQAGLQHREETQKASAQHTQEQQALLKRLERVEQDLQVRLALRRNDGAGGLRAHPRMVVNDRTPVPNVRGSWSWTTPTSKRPEVRQSCSCWCGPPRAPNPSALGGHPQRRCWLFFESKVKRRSGTCTR
jgi:chromosome segregation ATPase